MLARTIVMATAAWGAAALAGAGEPARTVLLENERVRVVEVAFEPGDVEPVQSHATDLLVVAGTPGGIEKTHQDKSLKFHSIFACFEGRGTCESRHVRRGHCGELYGLR